MTKISLFIFASGISPTGRRLQIRMVTVHRIAEAKITEDWELVESPGVFQQLGAFPVPQT
jgi:predicted ester cyclase